MRNLFKEHGASMADFSRALSKVKPLYQDAIDITKDGNLRLFKERRLSFSYIAKNNIQAGLCWALCKNGVLKSYDIISDFTDKVIIYKCADCTSNLHDFISSLEARVELIEQLENYIKKLEE